LAESDFWHDLAKEFRELPCADLRAEWILYFVPGSIPVWELHGNYSAQVRFRALAIRAGTRLVGRAPDFMFIWLDALNKARDYGQTIRYTYEQVAGKQVSVERGTIAEVCQASADHCHLLEASNLENERIFAEKEREENDPRNWSPLRQELEAIDAIKKLYAQPPKEVSEAVVRSLIARREGVKPEDVPLEQIVFEVSGLLKHYGPKIELVSQDAAPLPEPTSDGSSQPVHPVEPEVHDLLTLKTALDGQDAILLESLRSNALYQVPRPQWLAIELIVKEIAARLADVSISLGEPHDAAPALRSQISVIHSKLKSKIDSLERSERPAYTVERQLSIGEQIDGLRDECALSIEELAEKVGLHPTNVSRHIHDQAIPSRKNLAKYSKIFAKLLKREIVIRKTQAKRS
jgi:ribosome-binding protein aMBF1 (putative translation factor)